MTLRARIRRSWLSLTVLILVLTSAIQLAYFSHRNGEITSCQVKYNQALVRAVEERSEIASDDREALNDMIRAITTEKSVQKRSAAVRTYVARQDESDRQRSQNPFPKLPPGECR